MRKIISDIDQWLYRNSFLSKTLAASLNRLANIGRGHYEEHFCEI